MSGANGKGDARRPCFVSEKKFSENWNLAFRHLCPRCGKVWETHPDYPGASWCCGAYECCVDEAEWKGRTSVRKKER